MSGLGKWGYGYKQVCTSIYSNIQSSMLLEPVYVHMSVVT